MLQVNGVSVRFAGVAALNGIELDVVGSQITGLIGPNGAGKTTFFNVVTGLLKPDQGTVSLDGRDITSWGASRRAANGIGRTFQRLEVFGSLSVMENVLVALEHRKLRGRRARCRAEEILKRVGLEGIEDMGADVLPTGTARLLELARALACEPRVLLLDEPFSGLNDLESAKVAGLLSHLAGQGLATLLVEHDMEMVMSLCKRIYVLDLGRVISAGTPSEVKADPAVISAYLGGEAANGGNQVERCQR